MIRRIIPSTSSAVFPSLSAASISTTRSMSTAAIPSDCEDDENLSEDSDSSLANRFKNLEKHPVYPTLFSPLYLGSPELGVLPNRVLMGSMHTGLEGHSMPLWMEKILNYVDNDGASSSLDSHHGDHSSLDRMATYFRRRAMGGVGLMVTGGISPNTAGWVGPFAAQLTTETEMEKHKVVTQAVHDVDVPIYGSRDGLAVKPKILLQILHSGRYGYHPFAVSATSGRSPISPFPARALTTHQVRQTIDDFVRASSLARKAGYDGVEIMGSEGYLISQFLSPRTNSKRTDQYGGVSFDNRSRFPLEIVREVRRSLGPDFMIIFRISLWELVDNGMSWEETLVLANELRIAGVTLLNTGIGWHESRVPTIASNVPRGAFVKPTNQLKLDLHEMMLQQEHQHGRETQPPIPPIVSTNRINAPETAELILQDGTSDLISMARPLLADPDWIKKSMVRAPEKINTCIACNQACLDHAFVGKTASCLVNPSACHETELDLSVIPGDGNVNCKVVPQEQRLNLGVVGGGPAGIAFACTAAELGHNVTMYERSPQIGGQFHMAKRVPGKEEFHEAIRYWEQRLEGLHPSKGNKTNETGAGSVEVKLNTEITVEDMSNLTTTDKWIVSTGVTPRDPKIIGSENWPDRVLSYVDVLKYNKPVGDRVAVIGAGGIGFDVAEFLLYGDNNGGEKEHPSSAYGITPATKVSVEDFWKEWGVDPNQNYRGGLSKDGPTLPHGTPKKSVFLMQRKKGKVGATLGRTTGWIHRASLKNSTKVESISGVKSYDKIDDNGNLVYTIVNKQTGQAETRILEVDTIVLCAGQLEERTLEIGSKSVQKLHNKVYPIGGAYKAGELDAKRAIDMGTRLAHKIHMQEVTPGNHVFESQVGPEEKLFRFLKKWT